MPTKFCWSLSFSTRAVLFFGRCLVRIRADVMPLPHQKIPLITFFLRLQPEFQVIPEVTGNSRPVRILPFEFLNNLSYPAAESSKALGLSNLSANKVKENFAAHFLSPPSNAISNKAKT
jgi:hypothetical protein